METFARLKLAPARALAEKIVNELAPACQNIEVAGSVRRGLAEVGDIDIVALPHAGAEADLAARFRACASMMLLDGGIAKRCLLRKSGIQCDLWIARREKSDDMFYRLPCNWGAMLLTYTGSMSHNIAMVARAKALGHTFRPGHGVIEESGIVHSVTEEEIFEVLKMPFLAPNLRK